MAYTAIDKHASASKLRTHDHFDKASGTATPYVFGTDNKPTTVPREFAMQLARNPDFTVQDDNGVVVVIKDSTSGQPTPVLSATQVIAELSELTAPALLARCQAQGGDFNGASSKPSMVSWLTNEAGKPTLDAAPPTIKDPLAPGYSGGLREEMTI